MGLGPATSGAAESQGPESAARPLLGLGSKHDDVAHLRRILTRIGLLTPHDSSADESQFDKHVDWAVRHFQQSRGLKVDGIVGPLTWRRALEARWQLGDRTLRWDRSVLLAGDDVAMLQRKLNDLGFDCGRTDGFFGPRTEAALREFQLNLGLNPNGVCDDVTLDAFAGLARAITGGRPEALREDHEWDHRRTGMFGKVVVIDPGHGDEDPGCTAHGIVEAEVVLDIAERVEKHLAPLGVAVLLTRGRAFHHNRDLDDAARAHFANSVSADAVISVHVDATASTQARGASAFFFGTGKHGFESRAGRRLAEEVLRHVCGSTGLLDLGCYPRTWDLLRLTRMPALRLYLGYASNAEDAELLKSGDFREQVAQQLASALVCCFTEAGARV